MFRFPTDVLVISLILTVNSWVKYILTVTFGLLRQLSATVTFKYDSSFLKRECFIYINKMIWVIGSAQTWLFCSSFLVSLQEVWKGEDWGSFLLCLKNDLFTLGHFLIKAYVSLFLRVFRLVIELIKAPVIWWKLYHFISSSANLKQEYLWFIYII